MMPSPWQAHARSAGPIRAGAHRVLVIEPDGRIHHHDFASLAEARTYAADTRYETQDDRGSPLAYIVDEHFVEIA